MTSAARKDINNIIYPMFAGENQEAKRVLFVGVNRQWDYRALFNGKYETMDLKEELNPDIIGDITSCPEIPDNTYDAVLLVGMYEYMKDKKKGLREVWRITRPGGKVLGCFAGTYYSEKEKQFSWDKMSDLEMFKIDKVYLTYYRDKGPNYYHIFMHK